jgi:hypothetical protein
MTLIRQKVKFLLTHFKQTTRIFGRNILNIHFKRAILHTNNFKKLLKMKTTINNNLRVYQIVTSTGKQMFCNIEQLNYCVNFLECCAGYFKIYHFWNNKPQKLTKKGLTAMFDGSQLKQEFHY